MFIPLHVCLVLFLYSDSCHLGAVSYHNPQPGGTHGHTWRLLGPTDGEAANRCLSFEQKGISLCLLELVQVTAKDTQHYGGSVTGDYFINHFRPSP